PIATDVRFASLSVSSTDSCAVSTAGTLYCWTATASKAPAPFAASQRFRLVRTGVTSGEPPNCAIGVDSLAYCWGSGGVTSPTLLRGNVKWSTLAEQGGCGLAADSTAYCLGDYNFTPAQVNTQRW